VGERFRVDLGIPHETLQLGGCGCRVVADVRARGGCGSFGIGA